MIKYNLSAVRHLQVDQGWGDARIQEMAMLQLNQVLEDIKQIQHQKKILLSKIYTNYSRFIVQNQTAIMWERAVTMGC